MKKLLLAALAACAILATSCNSDDSSESGSTYATVTVNGKTWSEAEIYVYSHTITDSEIPFYIILDAGSSRTNTGFLSYYPEQDSQKIAFQIMYGSSDESYRGYVESGTQKITKNDSGSYTINIDGTDTQGKSIKVKGAATVK